METITITLNGVEVSGHAGMTVLELARESGVDIPTLCHDPCLAPYGACRICLVENEPTAALLASCVTPIAPGMVINTRSPRVLERRSVIVKLMLASHPDSCLVCDKGNRCQLRHIAADLGVGLVDYRRIPQSATIEEVNPFIERDLSKCILCAKCIRADQELVAVGALDYLSRGFAARPATLGDLPLDSSECTFCGTCVALCPTGALSEKVKTYRGTVTRRVPTVCPYCGSGCSLYLEVKDNHIVRARPNDQDSINGVTLCARGAYGFDFVHSPERLAQPLVGVNGSFQAASWDEALGRVAEEMGRIKRDYGPDSLAVLGSPLITNEESYLLQKLARVALGTNNIDSGGFHHNPLFDHLDSPLPLFAGPLSEIEQAGAILLVGGDPTTSSPAVAYALKRAVRQRGASLVLISSRRIPALSGLAKGWLRPAPGTEQALINSLLNVIISEGLEDKESVAGAGGVEALKESIQGYSPEYVAEVTGVPAEEIRRSARLLASARRKVVLYGNGLAGQNGSGEAIASLFNLALAMGSLGPYALPGESNTLGAAGMGALPHLLPGWQRMDDARARQRLEGGWGVALPAAPGLTAPEMILQARVGKIKGMYIVGHNPLSSLPNPTVVREALSSLEFLAVQDLFLTETAKLASVVLPAASFAEKDGSFTNFQGRVQRLNKAIEPVGESRPDWQIISQLARLMGLTRTCASLQQVREEMAGLVPSMERASGTARFLPISYRPLAGPPRDGYPLRLLVGNSLFHFGGGTRSSRSPRLKQWSSRAYVEVNPGEARRLGVADGEPVRIVSSAGTVEAAARIADTVPEGVVFMPLSFPDTPASALFDLTRDSSHKPTTSDTCFVRLERIG